LDVCGKVVMYSDKGEPVDFIQTDLDRIEGKGVPEQVEGDKDLMAVVVEFTLGSSEYATMVLRELTKMETSAGFQTQLSQKSNDHSKKRPASEVEN
jgi:tRNA pseudouridine13 synthase